MGADNSPERLADGVRRVFRGRRLLREALPHQTVLPWDVVNAVSGGMAIEGDAGSAVSVDVEPLRVGGLALGLAGVGACVGSLANHDAVEALDLVVGLWPVGAGRLCATSSTRAWAKAWER